MATNLHLVFSKPPAAVTDAAYDAAYDIHLRDILEVPGFAAGRRFRLATTHGTDAPSAFPFLAVYIVDRDFAAAFGGLSAGRDARRMNVPEWFAQVEFASWNATQIGEVTEAALPEHLYFVFSAPPPSMSFADYSAWYQLHVAENVANSPLLARSWRHQLDPVVVHPTVGASPDMTHLALYELTGDAGEMSDGLHAIVDAGGIRLPEWFKEIRFTALDATAVGERVEEPRPATVSTG